MAELLAKKPTLGQIALAATAVGVAAGVARYYGTRKISAAERLAEALLDTERLRNAAQHLPDASATTLAGCAAYLARMACQAATGLGAGTGPEDPVGFSRTHTHPYTRAVATVLTETSPSEPVLTYAVTLPDIPGEIRGTRRIGPIKMWGLTPGRSTPDTMQISLGEDYTAQLEADFKSTDRLLHGRSQVFGTATLRDNRGNVGHLNIADDGGISGTITREGRVIGRFEGKVTQGLHYKQYQLEPGE